MTTVYAPYDGNRYLISAPHPPLYHFPPIPSTCNAYHDARTLGMLPKEDISHPGRAQPKVPARCINLACPALFLDDIYLPNLRRENRSSIERSRTF